MGCEGCGGGGGREEGDDVPVSLSLSLLQARGMMQPYLRSDGNFLLRPSGGAAGEVICTICVT